MNRMKFINIQHHSDKQLTRSPGDFESSLKITHSICILLLHLFDTNYVNSQLSLTILTSSVLYVSVFFKKPKNYSFFVYCNRLQTFTSKHLRNISVVQNLFFQGLCPRSQPISAFDHLRHRDATLYCVRKVNKKFWSLINCLLNA